MNEAFTGPIWHKMTPAEKAYYVRFYHNYHGSRNHKDGFDVTYNDDDMRKEDATEASRRRVDVTVAVNTGVARYQLDLRPTNSDDSSENYTYYDAGYASPRPHLEEDAMLAELDRKLGLEDEN